MSKYDRNYSRHQKHSYSKYKVIFDSNQDERRGSRSRSRIRSPSPQLLQAILDGHVSETLEVLNKNYKSTVESFKVSPENIKDPYDFTILPLLVPPNDVSELIESSRRLRREAKVFSFALSDARLKLMIAKLKSSECDAKLASIKSQLASYSNLT
jgi:hypothetical protein